MGYPVGAKSSGSSIGANPVSGGVVVHRRPKNHDRLSKKTTHRHSAPPGTLDQFKPTSRVQPKQPIQPSNRRKSTTANSSGSSKFGSNIGGHKNSSKSMNILTTFLF